jgi:hypothetical protein
VKYETIKRYRTQLFSRFRQYNVNEMMKSGNENNCGTRVIPGPITNSLLSPSTSIARRRFVRKLSIVNPLVCLIFLFKSKHKSIISFRQSYSNTYNYQSCEYSSSS